MTANRRGPRWDGGFTLLEVLVVLVVIGILAGISVTTASGVRERAYYTSLRSDLQTVAKLQESFWETQLGRRRGPRYANLNQLRNQMNFRPSPDVTVNIRRNANGWSARARHARLPRRSQCSLFMGTGSRPYPPATTAGVLSCR